jgi:hypothetical protein
MKKIAMLCLCLFVMMNLNAQEKKVKSNLFKIIILSPGLNFEKGIGKKSTISSDIGSSVGFHSNNSGTEWLISPYVKEQYRLYYNLENREQKGKNISNNSGNFVAFSASYYFNPIGNSNYVSVYDGLTLAPVWGLQRTYNSGLNFTVNTGVGYNISRNNNNKIVPVLNFSLGWIIGK